MKKLLIAALLAIGATTMFSAIAGEQANSESGEAVSKVARDYVVLIYGVAPTAVELSPPKVEGAWASLQARVSGKVCELMLQKNATANQYGWVIQTYSCK